MRHFFFWLVFGFRVSGFGLPFFNVAVTTREREREREGEGGGGGIPEIGLASLTAVLLLVEVVLF